MFGGTVKLEQQAVSPNVDAHVEDGFSFGLAGGFRLDSDDIEGDVCEGCDIIEFRWLRQNTHLALKQNPLVPAPVAISAFDPGVTMDYFLADFTHQWTIEEARKIKPFITASLGAALMSTPQSNAARFVFGIGTGLEIEYLPIVMRAEVQTVVCAAGCVVALGGGLMNRFQVTVGPTFRF
jgi:hypothetical protein